MCFKKKQDLKAKVKIGAVSYLNTKPLVYAFEQGAMDNQLEITFDYPSKVAQKLQQNEIDLGLVPVAVIPKIENAQIVSDFCIATDGEVASVCLFSDVPLHQIESILLDYQSRTSVALLKILLQQHWKISPVIIEATEGFENQISGTTAGLIIGDRALLKRNAYQYVFDLGMAWKEMTGLPFVFAVWLANKELDKVFVHQFNQSIEEGLTNIELIAKKQNFAEYDLLHYYRRNINYQFDENKKRSLDRFLSLLKDV